MGFSQPTRWGLVKTYKKGAGTQLSTNFSQHEADCRCTDPDCGITLVDTDLILALESLRIKTGRIKVNDMYRCEEHNKTVGGVLDSMHVEGKAADIETDLTPEDTADLAEHVQDFANGGIGRYDNFTHLDVRGYRARWSG